MIPFSDEYRNFIEIYEKTLQIQNKCFFTMQKSLDFENILKRIYHEVRPYTHKGKVASYIPALANVPEDKFGMAVTLLNGQEYKIGNADEPFSIQSISKVLTLTLSLEENGDNLWKRVGREPSGTSFNSLVQLEYENGIPRNPFINAGAIIITDSIYKGYELTINNILEFTRKISGNKNIDFDEEVAESEKEFGDRNRALAYFMRSFGNFTHNVESVLDVYFHQCSMRMSCLDLSRTFLFLANAGYSPIAQNQVIDARQVKRINAVMSTCGLYDSVGEFAYWVGLPGKSGVGGGIVAIIPGHLSVAVWSPALNQSGNSVAGTKALELFTSYTGISVY